MMRIVLCLVNACSAISGTRRRPRALIAIPVLALILIASARASLAQDAPPGPGELLPPVTEQASSSEAGVSAPAAAAFPFAIAWSSSDNSDNYASTDIQWADYDQDGDLDLATTTLGAPTRLFRNENGQLTTQPVWSSANTGRSWGAGWADYDGDGDLDLAVAYEGQTNRLYRNDNGNLTTNAAWETAEVRNSYALAWGDYDGDGDPDLAFANNGSPLEIYQNKAGVLSTTPDWSSATAHSTYCLAWGDIDNDGDLDLAVGNNGSPVEVYYNSNGSMAATPGWQSTEAGGWAEAVAWGDYDGDGYLDLAVANYAYTYTDSVYRNQGGTLSASATWKSETNNYSEDVAWGDFDSDGDLDLITAAAHGSLIYRNDAGSLTASPAITFPDIDRGWALAWGDYDGDGDIDLAIANAGPDRIYRNDSGVLLPEAGWASDEDNWTESIAWGDYDKDGDPDLAAATSGEVRLYRNNGGVLSNLGVWFATAWANSVAWVDYDNDGDVDLSAGGARVMLFRNNGGTLATSPVWSSSEDRNTRSIAWADVDKNGFLDVALGNFDQPNQIYLNFGGTLATAPSWSSSESDKTTAVAWGDYNGDGYPDLAAGNDTQPNRIYRNNRGTLVTTAEWFSTESDSTQAVAWNDYDKDGDQDLAVGNVNQPIRIYRNSGAQLPTTATWSTDQSSYTYGLAWGDYNKDGYSDLTAGGIGYERVYRNDSGSITKTPVWSSTWDDNTQSVAWADVDKDGDVDLATGNGSDPNRLFRNDSGTLTTWPAWSSCELTQTYSSAWGDYDGDGDLDLAIGNYGQPNAMYRNDGGTLTLTPTWWAAQYSWTYSVAWGDYDGDGDLDLAAGNTSRANTLYRNDAGALTSSAVWSSSETNSTYSVAWGDYDGDGDLDLAAGNYTQPNRIYRNDNGALSPTAAWQSAEVDSTVSVAWGDYDGDGDLDLAAGNWDEPIAVYRNNGGALETRAGWSAADGIHTYSVAWADYDSDGDLDLAAGYWYGPTRLYRNENGVLSTWPVWVSLETSSTRKIAWADYDGDADMDLTVVQGLGVTRVYRNDHGELSQAAAWASSDLMTAGDGAWGDVDLDGDLDLVATGYAEPEAVFANSRNTQVALKMPGATGLSKVRVGRPRPPANANFYSAPTTWPASGSTIAINYTLSHPNSRPVAYIRAYYSVNGGGQWLPAVPTAGTITANLATSPAGISYTYNWDVFASGFFGKSDNVVFRIVAVPDLRPVANNVPGPFLFGANASDTFPFRVRGTQVRVMQGGAPVKDALVYRRPAGDTEPAQLITSLAGEPFRTDAQGYLQGRGTINVGDQLFALAPAGAGSGYTLYHTNAAPTATGLDGFTVTAPGVQTLTVAPAHPLLLFNLDVSLEWDARNDAQFLTQLNYDLQRASEFLYDWTNGQAALGKITIHHNRELWQDAHVRIYATNRLRPSAVQGGVVSAPISDTTNSAIAYYPGQLFMGAVWNRYGNAGSSLDEDWPRTFSHELGHYVLYLQDNYLGRDAQGQIIPVDGCSGAMADPYRDDVAAGYGEFHAAADWLPSCAGTLSHLDTGRADWSTITAFYPQLDGATANSGPATLPLAVTAITYVEPAPAPVTLKAPIFFLAQNGARVQPGSSARALLYRGGWATDLGRPTLDQLLARGAAPGDRICLYEPAAQRLGCETVTLGDEQLALVSLPDWRPDLQLSPVTSRTLTLNVTGVPAGLTLKARLYPLDTAAGDPITLAPASGGYTGAFNPAEPTFQGYAQVWVEEPEPRREAVIDFTLGSNPGHQRSGGSGKRSDGGHQRSGGAPVMSADGQVILFAPDAATTEEWFYTLQATSAAAQPPPWGTAVGQAYRLTATANAPSLAGASVSFSYLGAEVPPGEEEWLKLYYHDGSTWTRLATTLDTYHNLASAPVAGQGVYALVSSIEVTLDAAGWNFISYPVRATRPVTEALISATGYYTTVYGYEPADTVDPWKIYDVTAPAWVNDLENLEFGRGYWINVSQALILLLKGASGAAPAGDDAADGVALPPATYYGRVLAGPGFDPPPGAAVTAYVGDKVCGRAVTRLVDGHLVYSINVSADGAGAASGCGAPGRRVAFEVGGVRLPDSAAWSDAQAWRWNLSAETPRRVYLPVILRPR